MDNSIIEKGPITDELIQRMDKYFRAANYLSAGQLYLLENPLLKKPLTADMVKKKSDYVSEADCDEGGVAEIIEKFVL